MGLFRRFFFPAGCGSTGAARYGCRRLYGVALVGAAPRPAAAETIEAALARAYENNPQLNAQRAIVRQTDEGVAQALSGYRPTLSANAAVGEQFTNETGTHSAYSAGIAQWRGVHDQRIHHPELGRRYRPADPVQRRADRQQGARGRKPGLPGARDAAHDGAIRAAIGCDRLHGHVARHRESRSATKQPACFERTLKDTRNRFSAGQVTLTDVAQAEAQLAAGEASLHAAESTLMTTKANYRRIIGNDPANLAPASPVDRLAPPTLNAAIALGAAQNPSVLAALYGVDVAQLQVKIAEGALWPTLALQGSVQQQTLPNIITPNLFLGTAMLNLSVPIYQGGAEYSAIRLDKETVAQQRLNVDQVRDQTRANVVQAWGQLQAAKAQVEAAHRQNEASERALNGVRNEAQAGQRTTLDLLNAQQALVNARVSLIVAQHDRVVASYSLVSAVGRLSAEVLGLPVSVYDPATHYHQVRDAWFGMRTPSGQ